TSRVESGGERTFMGSRASAALANEVMGAASVWYDGDHLAVDQTENDASARARFNDASLGLVTAEGSVLGRTDLRAGNVARISGAGDRFSGAYYIHSVAHRYTPMGGYITRFSARRNAL